MDQLSPSVGDEEEHMDSSEPNCLDDQQVGSPDPSHLVGEERPPPLSPDGGRGSPTVSADRSVADHDPELEELTSDSLATPEWILAGDAADELADLGADAPTAYPGS